MFELSKQFRFDSAHSLERQVSDSQKLSSLRIHGHSYRAEVTLRGALQSDTGMVVDLDVLESALQKLHTKLDHQMLNDISGLEVPTLENIALWIWQQLSGPFPQLLKVGVFRDSSGDCCIYRGER